MQSHFSATRPETFGKIFEFPVQSLVGPENSGAQMATHLDFFNSFPPKKSERPYLMAGAPGFEPGNGGIKIRCLTTWLRPNRYRKGRGEAISCAAGGP